MAASRDSESLGDLFGRLSSQLGTLIRQEIELGRAELTASAQRTARNASLIGVGAAVGYAAFLALVAAAVALLDAIGLDTWLAALIVGLVLGGVAFALVQRGRSQLDAASLAPRRTIESLKDDAELAKERVR
jgi:cbb3-type cytochrome oxidase subunit 3